MAELRLEETRSVVLDATGSAVVLGVGPVRYGDSWQVTRISVSSTSRCTVTVHRGMSTDPITQLDGTQRGDLDTSETSLPLMNGETISFRWSKGTPGASSTIRIEGVKRTGY